MKRNLLKIATLISLLVSSTLLLAQTTDSLKSEIKTSTDIKKTVPGKPIQSMFFVPYYFNPYKVNYVLKGHELPTNYLLLKRNSVDNAMNSIYITLDNDRRKSEAYKIAGIGVEAAILGGVLYQAINAKHFSEEAQRRREVKPPLRK